MYRKRSKGKEEVIDDYLSLNSLIPPLKAQDANYLDRDQLNTVFFKTATYENVASMRSSIICLKGKKGSGKSAILRKIAFDSLPHSIWIDFRSAHRPVKESIGEIDVRRVNNNNGLSELYEPEWKKILWINLIQNLYIEYERNKRPIAVTGEYYELFKFLRDNHLLSKVPIPTAVISAIKSIKINFGKDDPGITFETNLPTAQSLQNIATQKIDNLISPVAKILMKEPTCLIVDETDGLDEWTPEIKASLLGMIKALSAMVRDITQHEGKNQTFKVLVSMREDMFRSAMHNYVNAQKIPNELVELSWTLENQKELVARQIRSGWGFSSNEIQKEKLINEIMPYEISWNDNQVKTFALVSDLTQGNPRCMYRLLHQLVENAVKHQSAYLNEDNKYTPMLITPVEFYEVIVGFSEKELSLLKQVYEPVFPGLSTIIDQLKPYFRRVFHGTEISSKSLCKKIGDLLRDSCSLADEIGTWCIPNPSSIEENVIQILIEVGLLISVSNTTKSVGMGSVQKSRLKLHPTYQPAFLGLEIPDLTHIPKIELALSRDMLLKAIDDLRNNLLPENRTNIPVVEDNVLNQSFYQAEITRYQLAKLLWCIRLSYKKTIAYGHRCENQERLLSILSSLDNIVKELRILLLLEMWELNTIAVFMNSKDSDCFQSEDDFAKDLENSEDHSKFIVCARGIYEFVKKLEKPSDRIRSIQSIDEILSKLRDWTRDFHTAFTLDIMD